MLTQINNYLIDTDEIVYVDPSGGGVLGGNMLVVLKNGKEVCLDISLDDLKSHICRRGQSVNPTLSPDEFSKMIEAIEKIANEYNLQVGFAYDRGEIKPEDEFQIVINLEPKDPE